MKNKRQTGMVLVVVATLLLALLLSSCARRPVTPAREPAADPTAVVDVDDAAAPTEAEESGPCPEPAAGTALLTNERLGYCFLYPETYTVERWPDADEVFMDPTLNQGDPRLGIAVEDAAGRTARQVADGWLEDWASGSPSFDLPHSTVTLAGEEAVLVDEVPFQQMSRVLLVVHGNLLYRLTFVAFVHGGAKPTRSEQLYAVVTDSFRFLDEAGIETATFCPEVPRPALLLAVPGQGHVILEPGSGTSCGLPLPASETTMPQLGGQAIFYRAPAGEGVEVIWRLRPGRAPSLLAATAVTRAGIYPEVNFIISHDGTMIAWMVAGSDKEQTWAPSNLFVASVTDADQTPMALVSNDDPQRPEVLQPVRFSADGSLLYYTLLPVGVDHNGIGRYQNLYVVPASGGESQLLFDCAELELRGLCLGDFQVRDNQVVALAYADADRGEVVVIDGEGVERGRFAPGAAQVGFPTFGPDGRLFFYSASRSESGSAPQQATIHSVASPGAPAEVVAVVPAMMLPNRVLADGRLVVDYASDFENIVWHLAVLGEAGELQMMEAYPGAQLADILR